MLEITVMQVLQIEAKSVKCIKRDERYSHFPLEEIMYLARNRRDNVIRRYARWRLKTTEYICEKLMNPPLLRFSKFNGHLFPEPQDIWKPQNR